MGTAVLAGPLRPKRRRILFSSKHLRILWLGVGCALSLVVAACSSGSGSSTAAAAAAQGPGCQGADVPFGVVTSLSGEYQAIGDGELGAVKTAAATLGCFQVAGKSYKFEVYSGDDQGDPTIGTSLALGLVRQDHVVALDGGSLSGTAQTQVAQDNGIIYFASANDAAPDLLKSHGQGKDATIFAKAGYPSAIYSAWAQGIIKQYPALKTGMIMIPANAVQYGVQQGLTAAFKAVGVTVSTTLQFAVGTLDFSSLLKRVQSTKPDMLVVCCDAGTTAAVAKQAVGLGLNFKLLAAPDADSTVATSQAIGKPLPFPFAYEAIPTDPALATGPFLQYLQNFNKYSGFNSKSPGIELGSGDYSSIYVLAKAMQKAGTTTDAKAIAKVIPSVSVTDFTGLPFQYDSNHVAPLSASACFVDGGKASCGAVITSKSP